jgi:F-box protein 11
MSAAHYLQYEMPDEVLLTIFSYLLEQDLCRVSLVCKRFQAIANDCGLWKRLYQNVYEYDLPLFNPEHGVMNFVKVEDCEYANPWKESFRQLYHGIHVRPGYQDRKYQGRNISYFNTVQAALDYGDYADERNASANNSNLAGNTQMNGGGAMNSGASSSNLSIPPGSPNMNDDNASGQDTQSTLIFLHAGIYRGEFLVIDSDITLIGAASGNVAESIVLERESESTVMFVEGAKNAYIGHMTLKFSPDITSTVPHHKHYCLEVGENCSPTIDHCIIRSTSVGE